MRLSLRDRVLLSCVGTAATCVTAYLLVPLWLHTWLIDFWLYDLPPFSDAIRILAYGGIFLTAYTSYLARPPFGDSPLQGPELYAYTLPFFFSLEGAMKLGGKRWLSYAAVRFIRDATVLGFICCTLGFGGPYPAIVVGLGMLVLHGVVSGCIGTSHRWYVPVYTCLALAFSHCNGPWSLDYVLYQRLGAAYPFSPVSLEDSPVLCSGLGRKIALVCGMATLFFGAITKVLNAGWAWLDGAPLAYYVSSEENGSCMWLKDMMHRYKVISTLLSIGAWGLEAASYAALCSRFLRPLIIISAAGLHLGIWMTMWPNYFPQTFCYMIGTSLNETEYTPNPIPVTDSTLAAAWGATALCVFLHFITFLRVEWWPLTGIPMYSFYRDETFDYKYLRDVKQAQHVANEHMESQYPNALAWSNLWIVLRLKNVDPAVQSKRKAAGQPDEPMRPASPGSAISDSDRAVAGNDEQDVEDLTEQTSVNMRSRFTTAKNGRGVLAKQYRRTLHNVAAVDMAAKPAGHIDVNDSKLQSSKEYPAQRWLRESLPIFKSYDLELPKWAEQTGELQLRCRLKNGYAVLAKIPWNAAEAVNANGKSKKNL